MGIQDFEPDVVENPCVTSDSTGRHLHLLFQPSLYPDLKQYFRFVAGILWLGVPKHSFWSWVGWICRCETSRYKWPTVFVEENLGLSGSKHLAERESSPRTKIRPPPLTRTPHLRARSPWTPCGSNPCCSRVNPISLVWKLRKKNQSHRYETFKVLYTYSKAKKLF